MIESINHCQADYYKMRSQTISISSLEVPDVMEADGSTGTMG